MQVFYVFSMTLIGALIMCLHLRVLFNSELNKNKSLPFIFLATLVIGTNTYLLYNATIYKGLFNLILYLILTKYFFKLNWGRTVLGIGLFFIATTLGEGVSVVVLGILGMPLTEALTNISVGLFINIITFTVTLLFIFLYSNFLKNKVYVSSDKTLITVYVAATLFSVIIFHASQTQLVIVDQQSPPIMVVLLLSLFVLSTIIFFFTNNSLSIKKDENVRLINDVHTIKQLNQQLEAEIEERKKLEEQLKFYATTDTLTGVLNRRTGILLLENSVKEAKRNGQSVTICFVDVNFLKKVNDEYGHNEGDELIVTVSKILKDSLRESDNICRLGGDEFLLILPNCNKEQAQEASERIKLRMEHYNASKQKAYKISLSYGFAEYSPESNLSIDELIEVADKEMYQMKEQSRYA